MKFAGSRLGSGKIMIGESLSNGLENVEDIHSPGSNPRIITMLLAWTRWRAKAGYGCREREQFSVLLADEADFGVGISQATAPS